MDYLAVIAICSALNGEMICDEPHYNMMQTYKSFGECMQEVYKDASEMMGKMEEEYITEHEIGLRIGCIPDWRELEQL